MNNKYSLWGSFIWTTCWLLALLAGAASSAIQLIKNGIGLDYAAALLLCLAMLLYLLKPYLKKIKNLRQAYATDDLNRDKSEDLRFSVARSYRRLCNRRLLLALLFIPIFYLVPGIFLVIALPAGQWIVMLQNPAYHLIPAALLVLFFVLLSAKNRNLLLIEEVYTQSVSTDAPALEGAGEKEDALGQQEAYFLFTSRFFLNWDGKLLILPTEEIQSIRYRKYHWLIVSGVYLEIHTTRGKRRIFQAGPSLRDWQENLPRVVAGQPCAKDGADAVRLDATTPF